MPGPLILFEEDNIDKSGSTLAVINNTFELIQGYYDTNIIKGKRGF